MAITGGCRFFIVRLTVDVLRSLCQKMDLCTDILFSHTNAIKSVLCLDKKLERYSFLDSKCVYFQFSIIFQLIKLNIALLL